MGLMEEQIRPMLAKVAKPFDSSDFIFELKLDGTRTIAYIWKERVKLLNRRLVDFTSRYPEFWDLGKHMNARNCILDGEVVVFSKEGIPDFYALQTREHVSSPMRIRLLSQAIPATFVVFDILYLDGKDLTSKPLIERKRILEKVVKEGEHLLISKWVETHGVKFFEEVRKRGLEGIMAKRKDSPYLIGKRSDHWLKIKVLQTLDCVIIGFTKGSGWRGPYFGALVLGIYKEGKLICIGKVGTGWSEDNLKRIKQKLEKLITQGCPVSKTMPNWKDYERKHSITWVRPRLVCEVQFMEFTKELELRAPSFKRLRKDKAPRECALEM
jgi:DNA ligase D-like protein (predicted ligase)